MLNIMENPLKPDRKYLIKGVWILLTISILFAFLMAIIHLIIHLAGGDMQAVEILWIICPAIIGALWVIGYPILYLWYRNLAGLINYGELHADLRERVRKLHPVSETVTTREGSGPADAEVWQEMLKELREIRKNTGK